MEASFCTKRSVGIPLQMGGIQRVSWNCFEQKIPTQRLNQSAGLLLEFRCLNAKQSEIGNHSETSTKLCQYK